MEKKLEATRYEIDQQLNQFIGNLKVDGMSTDAKISLVKLKIQLSKIMSEIEEFKKTTLNSIDKPENFQELKEAAHNENATDKDKDAYDEMVKEYNNKFAEVAVPYFNEVVSVPFNFINEEDFEILVAHNDINIIFGYEYIYNKLVAK